MAERVFYRGGSDLTPRVEEVKLDRVTALVGVTHGVSVFDNPDQVEHFGGAYRVVSIPESLTIIQRGRDPKHFEIVPAQPMSWDDYNAALHTIQLLPVRGAPEEIS